MVKVDSHAHRSGNRAVDQAQSMGKNAPSANSGDREDLVCGERMRRSLIDREMHSQRPITRAILSFMKRPVNVLLLCLLAGLLAWWWLRDASDSGRAPVAAPKGSDSRAMAAKVTPVSADSQSTPSQPATMSPTSVTSDDKTGPRYKRAYMLSLDQGALAFVEAQDIEGDFAPKRGREEIWSTMLRCRLMSETNAVLAEELLPAPDQVCQVLDPRSTDAQPVNFTARGPVIFQVRLPRVKGASRLDVFRIVQPGEPAVENLLGSLLLPRQ